MREQGTLCSVLSSHEKASSDLLLLQGGPTMATMEPREEEHHNPTIGCYCKPSSKAERGGARRKMRGGLLGQASDFY